jgi:hypothetical protein
MSTTTKELSAKAGQKSNGKTDSKDCKPASSNAKPALQIEPEKLEPKTLSIEEKLQKLEDLNDLVEKRNRLKASLSKMNSFNLKREDHSTYISLQDNSGNRFQTSNTKAVESFIELTRDAIQRELDMVENKIQF